MKKLLFYLIIGYASFANAQYNPELFATLYTGNNSQFGVNLGETAVLNNSFFFTSLEDDFSNNLYVTDGTVGNTIVLKNAPGVYIIAAFDNTVYFIFIDPTNGIELWKTDGTTNGTTSVSVLGGSIHEYATVPFLILANRLYFASSNTSNSRQLYVLDAGSNTPLILNSNLYSVNELSQFNGKVIFTASNVPSPNLNYELYNSDGTVAGTTLLKEINPSSDGSLPSKFTIFQNKLFFIANDGTSGNEIWTTDGTESGTQLFKDINPGSGSAMFGFFNTIYNNKLFFAAEDGVNGREFWSTDGTPNGTVLVKDINPSGNSIPSGFLTVNNKLLMTADDGVHGRELWVSDGTTQNTNLLLEINTGTEIGAAIIKSNVLCADQLFFVGNNGGGNFEPWVTDGTVAGTQLIEDINPSGAGVFAETNFVSFNNKIYFSGTPGTPPGFQPYVMDANGCILGIAETNSFEFKIYPNPAKNIINIETSAEISKVEIYNTLGQLVATYMGNNKQIELGSIETGIYFLTINTIDNTSVTKKIVLE